MSKVVVIAVMTAFVSSAFGEVIVYKQTTAFNPMVTYTEVNQPNASTNRVALQSYIVFNMDPKTYDIYHSTDVNNLRDPENPTAIIFATLTIYKYKVQMTLGGNDPNHPYSSVNISSYHDPNCLMPFAISNKRNAMGTFTVFDIYDSWMDFRVLTKMYATVRPTAINTTTKIPLAKSLKGNVDMVSSVMAGGFGPAKAALDPKYTRFANTSPAKTVKEVVTQIQDDLKAKGYLSVDKLPGFPCECEY